MTATIQPFQLPLSSPLVTASGTIDVREGFIFAVEDGTRGLGEACPLHPFTERKSDCREALHRAVKAYEAGGWSAALGTVSVMEGGQLLYPAARHAVSLALLDWRAKNDEIPLYHHLGGKTAPGSVQVNATIGDVPIAETVESGIEAVEDGFRTIKVKVGSREVTTDVKRIDRLRETIGTAVELRVDANGAWSRDQASDFIGRTKTIELDYIEQPLEPGDVEGHASLRNRGVDIALDESLATEGIQECIDTDGADVFVLKPMAVGGVDVARGVAMKVKRQGYRAVFSTTIDSVVARTAAAHAAASLPDIAPSGLATGEFLSEDLAADPAPVQNGTIRLPDRPGLGIDEVQV